MIELAKFGTLNQGSFFTLSKGTKMQFTPWLLTFHTGTVSFNQSDKVATGSFDKTAKLWET